MGNTERYVGIGKRLQELFVFFWVSKIYSEREGELGYRIICVKLLVLEIFWRLPFIFSLNVSIHLLPILAKNYFLLV